MRNLIAVLLLLTGATPAAAGKEPKPATKHAATKAPKAKPESGKTPSAATPAPAPKPAAGPVSVADTIAAMQKFYEATRDLHAKFDQELASGIGVKKKASGEVWLKKQGRMRWDYDKPEKKMMVADGSNIWVYEPEEEQAFKNSLKDAKLPSAVTFLFGTGKLTDEFTVTEDHPAGIGAPGDVVLKLVPLKPTAQYRYINFVVDAKSHVVKETVIFDQQGGTNHMVFRDIETNKGVADAKFSFTPPAGTKIIKP